MRLYKTLIISLLCAALAFSGLAGCANTQEPAETVAMGRYIEQVWQNPPAPDDWMLLAAHIRPDGKIAVIAQESADNAETHYYTTTDGTEWTQENPAWFEGCIRHDTSSSLRFFVFPHFPAPYKRLTFAFSHALATPEPRLYALF